MAAISETELLVMKCIWSSGRAISVVEILELMKSLYGKEHKHTTICTFLSRLKRKKFVDYVIQGKTYLYFPLISEKDYRKAEVRNFTKLWFGGSAKKMIASYCEGEKLSSKEIKELKDLINGLDD